MKRTILLFLMVQTICVTVHAQTGNYGPFSGTQDANSSYFGWSAGQLTSSSSANNSFFGAFSGIITQGHDNVGFGTQALFSNTSGSANMEGKQLKNIQVNDRDNAAIKISGSEFSAGIYLYALIVDGKGVDTKRLILTK